MSAPYITASTPQLFLPTYESLSMNGSASYPRGSLVQSSQFQQPFFNSDFAQSSIGVPQRPGSPIHIDQGFVQTHYPFGSSYGELPPQQVPYRGVGLTQPESLNFSVANRRGEFAHHSSLSGYSTGEENPSQILDHIQSRSYAKQEPHQDLQGLDIIRVQATRIDHLLDKIEILEREIERQTEIQHDKNRDIEYWEKQYGILEENRDDALDQMGELGQKREKQAFLDYMEDKNKIERKIAHKLKELEDFSIEIDYYKQMSAPKQDESNEIKRLQEQEARLIQENTNINKRLLAVSHITNKTVKFQ